MADAPKLLGTDTLRQAYPKFNQAIDNANEALGTANTAKSTADTAKSTADTALANSENTQTQLDTIVINGDSSVEAAQARVAADGSTFTTLKERLDNRDEQLADVAINAEKFKRLAPEVSDSPRIQRAMDSISFPSVLLFPYHAQYEISSKVLVNNNLIVSVIGNDSSFKRTQTDSAGTNYDMFHFDGLSNITISGLKLEQNEFITAGDAVNDNHRGMYFTNCTDVIVTDNHFLATGAYGVEFYQCENVVFERNKITRTPFTGLQRGSYGVAFMKSKRGRFTNNKLENVSVGIYFGLRVGDGVYYVDSLDINITNNHFINNSENNIYGDGYKGLIVSNNKFEGAIASAVKIRGFDVVVSDNIITSDYIGISITELSQNVTVTGNTILLDNKTASATNLGIDISMASLSTYLTPRNLDSLLRAKNIVVSDNIITSKTGDTETSSGIRLIGSSSYLTKGSHALQHVILANNIIQGFKNGIWLSATERVEDILIKDNKLKGTNPSSLETTDWLGVGIWVGNYTPNLRIEGNFIEKFFDGLTFDSRGSSLATMSAVANIFSENVNYGINYEKTFSGLTTHRCEHNTFYANGVGQINNPASVVAQNKTLIGADASGSNVYSASGNTLGKNAGFITLTANDGTVVNVPYWTTIAP